MIKSFYLYFPTFIHQGEVNFEKGNRTGARKNTSIFSLDWSKKEVQMQERNRSNVDKFRGLPYIDLPEKWDNYLKTKLFVIPVNYLNEIRHQSLQALMEWNRSPLSFDTMIREICISPAKSHITAAFKLIKDCGYDSDTKYYSRNTLDIDLLDHIMIYKFWSGQTGRGLLWRNAELDNLEQWVKDACDKNIDHLLDRVTKVKEFLSDMKSYEEYREKRYDSADEIKH